MGSGLGQDCTKSIGRLCGDGLVVSSSEVVVVEGSFGGAVLR